MQNVCIHGCIIIIDHACKTMQSGIDPPLKGVVTTWLRDPSLMILLRWHLKLLSIHNFQILFCFLIYGVHNDWVGCRPYGSNPRPLMQAMRIRISQRSRPQKLGCHPIWSRNKIVGYNFKLPMINRSVILSYITARRSLSRRSQNWKSLACLIALQRCQEASVPA